MWCRNAAQTNFTPRLFEFLRNDALDARNPFSTTVDPLTRNQFGFVAERPGLSTGTLQRQRQTLLDVLV